MQYQDRLKENQAFFMRLCKNMGIILFLKSFMPLIIGIDPGSRLTGYGIIEKNGNDLRFIDAGTIRTETQGMPERLKRIFAGVERIVKFYGPTEAAVEQVFMAQNPDSALKLGQARGAAIAALVNLDLDVAEYTARQIKQSVVG